MIELTFNPMNYINFRFAPDQALIENGNALRGFIFSPVFMFADDFAKIGEVKIVENKTIEELQARVVNFEADL